MSSLVSKLSKQISTALRDRRRLSADQQLADTETNPQDHLYIEEWTMTDNGITPRLIYSVSESYSQDEKEKIVYQGGHLLSMMKDFVDDSIVGMSIESILSNNSIQPGHVNSHEKIRQILTSGNLVRRRWLDDHDTANSVGWALSDQIRIINARNVLTQASVAGNSKAVGIEWNPQDEVPDSDGLYD